MARIVLLTACLAIMFLDTQAGEMYRWVDSNGIVHYSDTPPPKSEQADSIRFSTSAGSDESLPYETIRAKQNFPVTLYVGPGCGETCDQARNLLSKRGVPFTEKMLRTKEEVDAFRQLSGFNGIPALLVGKTYLGGFLEEQWQSELDIAGYPKTSLYRAPIKPAAPEAASEAAPANPAAQ